MSIVEENSAAYERDIKVNEAKKRLKKEKQEMENLENLQEKKAENETVAGETRSGGGLVVVGGGGYNKEKPPEDDCCPICFGDFKFPCKTNCGHWFCCGCILQLWRYSRDFEPCKCPMCGCMITKMIPEPSVLSQQGEEVGKVLKEVQKYNRLYVGELRGHLLKALGFLMPKRAMREHLLFWLLRWIGILLGDLYDSYDFHFFPNGSQGIRFVFEICSWALLLFRHLYALWNTWRLRNQIQE